MVDLTCTKCPLTAKLWRYDYCGQINKVANSTTNDQSNATYLVCITQLERAIYVALSEGNYSPNSALPPRNWKPLIPAYVKQAASTILNICVHRNNSRMLLYAYSHVLLTSDEARPYTNLSFRLALKKCAATFPSASSYNTPLVAHPRPSQSYKRNYGLGEIHLALPKAKQTSETKQLLFHLKGDVARLPDGCVETLEIIGNSLPSSKSFASGVDGIQYISLDGPDLMRGFVMCQTKSIKSLVQNKIQLLQQCSNDVNATFLSSINGLRMEAGSGPLLQTPAMKPAIIITAKESRCQVPHMDIKEAELREASFVGFIPLTKNGMYLEVWPLNNLHPGVKQLHGELIFIPLGVLLLLPATTLHAGGMKAPLPPMTTDDSIDRSPDIVRQHPRLHFYLFPTRTDSDYQTCNLFEMPADMRFQLGTDHRAFSEIFLHSPQLQYTPEKPGELALGLLSDITPILAERTRVPD